VTALSKLTELRMLDLGATKVRDVSALGNLT